METKLINILFILMIILLLNSCSDIFGTSYKTKIRIADKPVQLDFKHHPSPNTYKMDIKVKGESECNLNIKITIDNRVIKMDSINIKKGKFDNLIYSHDWFGNIPGLIVTPIEEKCKAGLSVKYTYYH